MTKPTDRVVDLNKVLRDTEEAWISWAMGQSQGNKTRAAQLLGLNRTTMHQKMVRLGMCGPDAGDPPPPDVNEGHV